MADESGGASKLTPEMQEEINKVIGGTVANMMTARLSSFEKKLAEKIQGSLAESLAKTLDERLAAFKPAETTEETAVGGKRGKREEAETQAALAMKKKIEDLEAQFNAASERAIKERSKNVDAAVRQSVFEALSEHGLDATRAKAAFAAFKYDNRIEVQADDDADTITVMFRDDDGTPMPLSDGLKRWVKTEPAKIYLPPTGARGSGSRPTNGSPNGAQMTPDQRRAVIGQIIEKELGR